MELIDVYNTETGKKLPHKVPDFYLQIFGGLSKTPKQKSNDKKES